MQFADKMAAIVLFTNCTSAGSNRWHFMQQYSILILYDIIKRLDNTILYVNNFVPVNAVANRWHDLLNENRLFIDFGPSYPHAQISANFLPNILNVDEATIVGYARKNNL